MPDELRPAQLNVQVHSLLHTNLNTADVSAAAAFYAELLELRPGMKTARTAADGRALGLTPMTIDVVPRLSAVPMPCKVEQAPRVRSRGITSRIFFIFKRPLRFE